MPTPATPTFRPRNTANTRYATNAQAQQEVGH
jgi:hypothetical protein